MTLRRNKSQRKKKTARFHCKQRKTRKNMLHRGGWFSNLLNGTWVNNPEVEKKVQTKKDFTEYGVNKNRKASQASECGGSIECLKFLE